MLLKQCNAAVAECIPLYGVQNSVRRKCMAFIALTRLYYLVTLYLIVKRIIHIGNICDFDFDSGNGIHFERCLHLQFCAFFSFHSLFAFRRLTIQMQLILNYVRICFEAHRYRRVAIGFQETIFRHITSHRLVRCSNGILGTQFIFN